MHAVVAPQLAAQQMGMGVNPMIGMGIGMNPMLGMGMKPMLGMGIGPKSIELNGAAITTFKTTVCNDPVGVVLLSWDQLRRAPST